MPEIDELADCLADNPEICHPEADESTTTESAVDETKVPKPFTLTSCPQVSTERAALSRMIGCGCSVTLPEAEAQVSIHLADHIEPDWSGSLVLSGQFGSIELADAPRLIRAFAGIDLSAEIGADDERWEWLQSASIARLAGTPFAATERLLRNSQQEGEDICTLRITLQTSDHAIITHARAEASSWLAFLGTVTWERTRRPFSEFASLPYETAVRVARHTLPRHALKGLGTGNFILPDEVFFGLYGAGYMQLGVLSARIRHQSQGIFIITNAEVKLDSPELSQGQDEVSDASADAAPPEPPFVDQPAREPLADTVALDNVPVTLSIEIGKVRMSLGELRTLGRDSIICCNGSPASLSIRCGDRLIGRGELVEVGGKIGVRITAWGPQC